MPPRHRNPLFLAVALLATSPFALAQFKNDFGIYPSGTQGCLDDAATRSQCSGDNVQTMNSCLCSNGGDFVTNAAMCIGREIPVSLRATWQTMSTSCEDSKVPVAITEDNFIRIGQAEMGKPSTRTTTSAETNPTTAASTTQATAETTATGTASQLPQQPSSTNIDEDELPPPTDLSVAVMAGIGVAGAVVASLIGGVAFLIWKRRRARKLGPQAPFFNLPDDSGPGSRNPTLREWKATSADYHSAHGPPPSSSGGLSVPGTAYTGLGVNSAVSPVTATATSPYPPSAAWTAHSPQAGTWGGNYHSPTWTSSPVFPQQPGAYAELPSDRQAAHELDSIEVPRPPVEMPAPYERHVQSGPVWADIKPSKS